MATVLVRPDGKKQQYGRLKELSAIEPPIWMAMLANHYDADMLIDMEADPKEVPEGKVYIIATGNHPSANYQQAIAAKELRDKLGRGEIITRLPCSPVDMGSPRWDMLDMTKYRAHNWHAWGKKRSPYGASFNSVSCPHSCSFCFIKDFYGSNYRKRNWADTYNDFIGLEVLGITNVKMMDEIFLTNNSNTNNLLVSLAGSDFNIWGYARIDSVNDELLRTAKRAGVNWLCYGIETSDEELRRKLSKGSFTNDDIRDVVKMTKDNGISLLGNYMYGFEGETRDDWKRTFDFAKELNCEYSNFYCYVDYAENENVAQYSREFKHPARDFRDWCFMDYFTDGRYLNMIEKKFGHEVVSEIKQMTNIRLERA